MPHPHRVLSLTAAAACAAIAGCAGQQSNPPHESTPTAAADTHVTGEDALGTPQAVSESGFEDAPVATTNTSRVTFADEGADFDPSVSRDGTWMAFASTQHRTTADIYLKRTNAKVITQLTNDPAEDAMPTISPDGKRIAFASNRTGNWDIFVMPITGGKVVQLTEDPADELHPSWSPDGSRLVYSRMNAGSARWEMWTIAASSPQSASFIGYGLFPQWCPVAGTAEDGGDKILFQLPRERGSRAFAIWTIDYTAGASGNPTQIAAEPDVALINPTWSPDGNWIAFAKAETTMAHGRPASSDLWMVSAGGEGLVRLTSDQAVAFRPTFGPGNKLFYVSSRAGADNVWSMDVSEAIAAASGSEGTTVTDANTESTGETPEP
ncbi:MAG: TolB family protein, partial [Phycisphaerales bacterium]